MVASISFGQVASATGKKLKTAVEKEIEYIKEDINSSKKAEKVDEFISTCTDNCNDGKLGFVETVRAFGDGVVDSVWTKMKGLKEDFVDRPIRTLAIGGLGVAALSGLASLVGAPFVFSAVGALGFIYGGFQVGKSTIDMAKSMKHLKNAKTDAEAKSALSNIGADTVDIGVNSLLMATSYGAAKNYATTLITKERPPIFSLGRNNTNIKVSSNPIVNKATKVPTRSLKRINLDKFGSGKPKSRVYIKNPMGNYENFSRVSSNLNSLQFYA